MAEQFQRRRSRQQRIFLASAIAIIIVAIGCFIAYDWWHVHVKTQAILGAPGIVKTSDASDPQKATEGSETTQVPVDLLANYSVADDAPRALYIDTLDVAARIQPMGLNADKSIQAPKNIHDSGWYTGSAKPGERGALFIDGHASGATRLGLFGSLDTLKNGDIVRVEKGDGSELRYKVVHVEVVALDAIDMNAMLKPYAGVERGLNLMSCTGVWLKDEATLDHRVVVYTQQV